MVGQVRPGGTVSTFWNRRGKRPISLALSCFAALDDQVARVLAGQDVLGTVAGRAQHAHRVVVREHHVLDRLVGHFADAAHHVGRHGGRGLGVGHQHAIVADHDAGVGVALGRVGPGVFRDLAEGDLLLFHVGLAGELLGLAHRVSPSDGSKFEFV